MMHPDSALGQLSLYLRECGLTHGLTWRGLR